MPKEKIITGIDIGSTKISTAVASVSDNKISIIGVSGFVPSKGISKGSINDIDSAVEAISASIEKAERMAGVSISSAFITVGGSHIETLNSHGVVAVMPNKSSEITTQDVARVTEAAQAVSLPSSREIIHVIPRDFIIDSQDGIKDPVGMSGVRLEVETNIIHGLSAPIKNLVRCVQQVGVSVEDLIYTAFASSESVLNDTEKELGTLLVDIGGGTTSLIAFLDGSPIYSAVLPIGGRHVTNDLAVGLRVGLDVAEKIKIKLSNERPNFSIAEKGKMSENFEVSEFGVDSDAIPRRYLYEIIDARLNEIFKLVSLELAKANLISKLPAGLVITGGGALTSGLEKVAKNNLKMPVRIGYPKGVTGLIDEVQGPEFSGTIGSILYGANLLRSGFALSYDKSGAGPKLQIGKIFEKLKSFLP